MNQSAELLNFIYRNSGMGVKTIDQILGLIDNRCLKRHLKAQKREYYCINRKSLRLLHESGYREKSISLLQKVSTYMMINMKALKDNSPSHIAEMFIIGSNMGIIDATKRLHQYDGADKCVLRLMDKLLRFEENNVQRLKEFL